MLHRAAASARVAEEARLARLMSEIAACRERADGLRRSLRGAAPGAAAEGSPIQAAELAVAARWRDRLASEARAEAARAEALGEEARAARSRLAQTFGRERALAELLERARRAARRAAERRAEEAGPPGGAVSQSSSPEREPGGGTSGGTSAGSPGMA